MMPYKHHNWFKNIAFGGRYELVDFLISQKRIPSSRKINMYFDCIF
jgi:hypothetical protein